MTMTNSDDANNVPHHLPFKGIGDHKKAPINGS